MSSKQTQSDRAYLVELQAFVEQHVSRSHWATDTLELSSIEGDAGFRKYFRLNTRLPMLAVWAPVETENSVQFCKIAQFLLSHGVRAPRVMALDLAKGFLVVEDFGNRVLLAELSESSVSGYYSEAMTMLLHLQAANPNDDERDIFPDYSEQLLRDELALFERWYLTELLGIELSQAEKDTLESVFTHLVTRALAQPQVVVHRDFHSRNLIVQGDGSLATIDFQDAVLGPFTYDLVSLLKDCYVVWPDDKVEAWALAYASMAQAAGLVNIESESSFLTDFNWMGMQRHIKVLGIFARLFLRDGKTRYLDDLPAVLKYLVDAAEPYVEFSRFTRFMRSRVIPRADTFNENLKSRSTL